MKNELVFYETFGHGAVGHICLEIIGALMSEGIQVTLAGRERTLEVLRHRGSDDIQGLRYHNCSGARHSMQWWTGKASIRLVGAELSGEAVMARIENVGAAATLINYPQIISVPRRPRRNVCVLIYDTNWRTFPENFDDPSGTDLRCRRWVEWASRVVTISNFTRDQLLASYDVSPEKVVAAPLAIPSDVAEPASPDEVAATLKALDLQEGRYYVYPSVLRAHKGHDFLVEVLRWVEHHHPVVLCGAGTDLRKKRQKSAHDEYVDRLAPGLRDLERGGRLRLLGSVARRQVQVLAHGARAFLLPSRYEGFGLPFAEAIGYSKPVICSDIPAFREIMALYAGRARYRVFDLERKESLAELLEADWRDDLQYDSAQDEEDRGGEWTWQSTARVVRGALSRMASADE